MYSGQVFQRFSLDTLSANQVMHWFLQTDTLCEWAKENKINDDSATSRWTPIFFLTRFRFFCLERVEQIGAGSTIMYTYHKGIKSRLNLNSP